MPKARSISWNQALSRRLARHALAAPLKKATPAEVASAMCGAHAQVMSAAELSIGIRLAGSTQKDVQHGLWTERSLVKTIGPRGTVHLLPTHELPLWVSGLGSIPEQPVNLPIESRLTPDQTDKVVAAIAAALNDAELTIDELNDEVIARAGKWAGDKTMPAFQEWWPRWRLAVGTAANCGALIFGANRGRNVTYTSPKRWLPKFKLIDKRKAIAEILRRYLASYGPVTPQNFAQWLGAPLRWSIDLFASLSSELNNVEMNGEVAWVFKDDTKFPSTLPKGVRLLPYFDAYLVGSHPRPLIYPGVAAQRASARGAAGNFPVLLVNGVAAGIWHQRRAAKRTHIIVEPFSKLTSRQRVDLEEQATRIGDFFESKVELKIGKVNLGPHA